MIFCMLSTQSQEEREGEKRKVISGQTTIHESSREKRTNQMMW